MKSSNRPLRLAAAMTIGACLALSSNLPAATFHAITAIGTNMTDGNPAGNPLSNIIQGPGPGFAAAEPHAGPSATWYTDQAGADYVSGHPGPEYIWLDLGSDVLLGEISYWGYATTNSNGVQGFNLSFATDAEGGAAGLGDESYGTSITANPAFSAALDNVPRQSFTFTPVSARYVRVEVTSTHFGGGVPGGDRVGVGEIAFEEVTIDPDPQISVASDVALSLTTSVDVFDIPVSNGGGAELTIGGVTFTGPNAAAFSAPSFPATLASLASDVIEVQFDPAGLVGPVSATMQIASNDPDTNPADVLLSGTVPPTEQDIAVPGPIDLGNLTAIDVFNVPVTNGGGTDLTITGTAFTGPDAAAFTVLTEPASIISLSSTNFEIQFDPAGLEGPVSATLQIMSNDPDTPTAEIEISAVALGDPDQFYPITSVEASTSGSDLWPASNLIQGPGVGFSDVQPHERTSAGAGGLWVTAAPGGFPADYIAVAGAPVLTFDLGADVSLCEVSVWGYSATNSNGLSEFSLRFATTAEGPTGAGSSIGYNPTFAGQGTGELPNDDDTSRFSFPFEQEVVARYVEFTCLDNHFIFPGDNSAPVPGGDRVGVGEVAFEITSCKSVKPFFDVEGDGSDLTLTWESEGGRLYTVRTSTDPETDGDPGTWAIFDIHSDIAATPPLNTLVVPRPPDDFRLFVVDSAPTPPSTFFEDNLDPGGGGWISSVTGDPGTEWELGMPVNEGPVDAHSGDNCYGTNIALEYTLNTDCSLQSPDIDLTNAASATLCYYRWISGDPSFDFLQVFVHDAADDSMIAQIETNVTDFAEDWNKITVGLPAGALGKSVYFIWQFTSDNAVNGPGVYIDTVSVIGPTN